MRAKSTVAASASHHGVLRAGCATTISFRVHARPLTPALSPGGGEGDDCSEHEAEEVRGPLCWRSAPKRIRRGEDTAPYLGN